MVGESTPPVNVEPAMVAEIMGEAVARLGTAGMETDHAVEALVRLLVLADVELDELDRWLRETLALLANGPRVLPRRHVERARLLASHGFAVAAGEVFELTPKGRAVLAERRAA